MKGYAVKNNEWIVDRVAYLKGLKSVSDQQALFILLAEKQNRSVQDDKKLSALVVAEKAGVRAAKARQEVANLINAEKKMMKDAQRKARNHRLILQGVLFDLAGLDSRSRGELLGFLLAGAATDDPQKWEVWKRQGDALLAEKGDQTDS